jgi:hypothetical protein
MIAWAAAAHRTRVLAGIAGLTALLAVSALPPSAGLAATDAQLTATLELPEGDIDFPLEAGTVHFFDEEGAPFLLQVIDGCAVNGYYWVFGAGLGGAAVPLTVFDERSGRSYRTVLPAYEPGGAIGTVLEPEALAICREGPTGGLPEAGGVATYTSVLPRCSDDADSIVLLSEGRPDGYRALIRNGTERDRVIADSPVAIVDDSREWDELYLLAEGRTPRQVEGVLFSGAQGMLPGQASLEKALADITKARVRRAFEAAKSWTVPQPLIDDLGLTGVDCIYHVSLEFGTPGADAYLTQAGWIEERGAPLEPPQLVAERFTVDLVTTDGSSTRLPLTGPFQGSAGEGRLWEYGSDTAKVQIIDGCDLSGSYWTVAAAVTDEPLELVITDPEAGITVSQLLWTDRESVSRLADTASLPSCP